VCGICGFVSPSEIKQETLKKMNDTMYHRGPDDSGEVVFHASGKCVGLAHRRLSIIDLSFLAHQPMRSYDKHVSLVFNGEIYNFKELKEQLDYPFSSHSDTEVIIAAYLKWGIECLSRLNGMFAFALYDHRDNALYLARDRIGKKPLYFWLENNEIVFASELKAIMSYPRFNKEIRREIIPHYLYQLHINAPDTIFKNTRKLKAGHYLKFKDGQAKEETWWDLIAVYHEKQKELTFGYEEAKHILKEKLIQAVKMRMIADVPLGSFLSGGYDSSLITALMQNLSDDPIKTFCIGFEDKRRDEAPYALAIAKHLGTKHTEHYISEAEMISLVDSIPKYYDEPFADASQIPTMLVSKLARNDVTVILTGDAGDEFFCGYHHYPLMTWAKILDFPGAITNRITRFPIGKGVTLLDKLPFMVQVIAKNRNYETKTQFGGLNYIKMIREMTFCGLPELYHVEADYHEPNWQRRRMLLDMMHYLPGDILCKVDRASMKYSLEARCPFLDVDVMEYSFSLHHSYKYQWGNKKRIIKDLAYEYIPRELLKRRKKGFCVPLDKWLHGPLRERLISYANPDLLKRQEIFNPAATQNIINNYLASNDGSHLKGNVYSNTIWAFFAFQQWYEEYFGK